MVHAMPMQFYFVSFGIADCILPDCWNPGELQTKGARILSSSVSLARRNTVKRIAVATLFGLCAGVICAGAAFSLHILQFSAVALVWVLLNRVVMGFAIGASGLRLHWAWNGVVLGIIVGSVFSYFLFMSNGIGALPIGNFFINGLFGLGIEFCTTVLCRQPALSASGTPNRAVVA